MANWARGLASGLETGVRIGDLLEQRRQREELAKAYGLAPQEQQAPLATPEQIGRAQAETQALAAQDAEMFGLAPQDMQRYAPAMPQEGARTGMSTYRLGEQVLQRAPTQAEIDAARTRAAADVYGRYGETARREELLRGLRAEQRAQTAEERAAAAESRAQRTAGLQQRESELRIGAAERAAAKDAAFDTAIGQISTTKYETPAEKDAAVLAAVERFRGPEAAAQLRANYSSDERNRLLTEGARFDQTIKQARLKGPAAALKAIDELNDSFTLEIDGFKVTQVNRDGTRVPFLQARSPDEFALLVDSRIREGGAYELAKFRLDQDNAKSLAAYRDASIREMQARTGAAANALSGVQMGYTRDKDGRLVPVLSGIRFNKQSGQAETIQVPLDQRMIPADAIDPRRIAEQAEAIVGQPIDPTNKKGPVHTTQSARQAVMDQIVNQYLGTAPSASDLSPEGLAKRIKEAAPAGPQRAPAPAAQPARQPAAMGVDTSRPSTAINPVTGLPREAPAQGPNLVRAVSGALTAGEQSYADYLRNKIALGEPLTRDEQMRAIRFGLQ